MHRSAALSRILTGGLWWSPHVFIGSYTKAERVEEFMHEFFLACNQSMPVKGKFLEEATPTPFVSSCFVYVKPPTHHSRERHRILSPTPYLSSPLSFA
jgi:hypothetical protein